LSKIAALLDLPALWADFINSFSSAAKLAILPDQKVTSLFKVAKALLF